MPGITVVFYRDRDGTAPALDWLDSLPARAQDKCMVRIERLEQLGHELRRPEAGYLRDGIYELRARHGGVQYRMLYFFHGRTIAVVAHGIQKQRASVPKQAIALALWRKAAFERAPEFHTYEE